MHSRTYLSTVPAVVSAPEEVEGLQTAVAFLSLHIRHPAGRLCTRQQKTTWTLEYVLMRCICRDIHSCYTSSTIGNSVTEDTQFSGTTLKVDENLADTLTMMLWSSSWQNRPEHHGQTIGRIAIHLQAGVGVLCILHASAS